MKRPCLLCRDEIETKTLETKYCIVCKELRKQQSKRKWYLKNYKQKKNLLHCTKCFIKLPKTSHSDRKYCDKCLKVRQSIIKRELYVLSKL